MSILKIAKLHLTLAGLLLMISAVVSDASASEKEIIITPRNGKTNVAKHVPLPASGASLGERTCSLERDSDGWVLALFEEKPKSPLPPKMRILPSAWLEAMELAEAKNKRILFKISGTITIHKKKCYLLPLAVSIFEPAIEEKPEKKTPPTKPEKNDTSKKDSPAKSSPEKPAEKPEKVNPGKSHSPDDLIDDMFKGGKITPILPEVPTEDNTSHAPSIAPIITKLKPLIRGSIIDNRIAYIVPVAGEKDNRQSWWKVVFVADNTLQDEPILILPNLLLERMQARYAPRSCPPKIRLSGQITIYKGRSYLLLKKAMPVKQLGQF